MENLTYNAMQAIAIILVSILAAVVYGILHDQVTARICVEYFTVGHPPVFHTDDPTLLGIGWGIIATWWVGLLLGVPLAIIARAGDRPQRSARSLLRPIAVLLGVNAICAIIAGGVGWLLARWGMNTLSPWIATRVPADKLASFNADYYAHLSSYAVGFLGGLVVLAIVWRSRIVATSSSNDSTGEVMGPSAWYRLQVSTWFVLLAALSIAILVIVPANVVHSTPEYESINIDTSYRLEHGWPATFLVRYRPPWFQGSAFEVVWGLGMDVEEFRLFPLCMDVAIAALAIAFVVTLAERRRRRPPRPRRFPLSLRALLATFTVAVVSLGWYCSERAADKELRMHLGELHPVSVTGVWPPSNDESLVFGNSSPQSRLPLWFCILFDGNGSAALGVNEPAPLTLLWHRSTHEHIKYIVDHFPQRVYCEFLAIESETDWKLITQLTNLEYAGFFDGGDETLAHLEGFTRLKSLQLGAVPNRKGITDRGLAHLRNLTNLKSLVVSASQINRGMITAVEQLPALENMEVHDPLGPDLIQVLEDKLAHRRQRPIRVYISNGNEGTSTR